METRNIKLLNVHSHVNSTHGQSFFLLHVSLNNVWMRWLRSEICKTAHKWQPKCQPSLAHVEEALEVTQVEGPCLAHPASGVQSTTGRCHWGPLQGFAPGLQQLGMGTVPMIHLVEGLYTCAIGPFRTLMELPGQLRTQLCCLLNFTAIDYIAIGQGDLSDSL